MTRTLAPSDLDRLAMARRPPGRAVMKQAWDHLLFLHWEVPAESIARLLPPGLEVDTFEDRAFVGLVPFTMKEVRPAGLPAVRGFSDFHETNVRTYVHARGRDPGVWFFSLDAASFVGCTLGRTVFGLPYHHARMVMSTSDTPGGGLRVSYASARFDKSIPATTRIVAEVSGAPKPAAVGTLEAFLAERYLLYSARGPILRTGRVYHAPYRLQPAEVLDLDETALRAAGIDRPATAPLAFYSPGVKVDVFRLQRPG